MRVGVFGGSFDPVHYGHLLPVEAAARKFGLKRVVFVPARLSPLKDSEPTDSRHRVAMLALALQGRPDWAIAFDELDRTAPSYTVDTLRAFSSSRPHEELWLLMGTDTLAGLRKWKKSEEIVRLARIAAYAREPFSGSGLAIPKIEGLRERLEIFDAGSVKISSSELRRELAQGGGAGGKIPGAVAEYITKHGLYRARANTR